MFFFCLKQNIDMKGGYFMCYKVEKHRNITISLAEKLKDVPDFISDFFDRYKSATTKRCYWGYIRDLLQWLINKDYIKKKSISDITKEDMTLITDQMIIKYLNDLKLGMSGKQNRLDSLQTKKNIFGAFWNYMLKNHYVSDNIIRNIPSGLYKSEKINKEVKIPTDEQVDRFITHLNDGNRNEYDIIRNITIVQLMLGSGIRSEELINLNIEDLYLDKDKPYIMVLGKGNIEEYDKVYISQSAKDTLIEYLEKERNIFVKDRGIKENALFLSNQNRRITKTPITNFFATYSNGEINPHMLRHWVGSKLYEKTKDIVLVQRQLRHKSLETAARYYVYMSDEVVADAMATL